MKWRNAAFVLLAWVVFWQAGLQLQDRPRPDETSTLRVRLPAPIQLAYAGGDPYLAANLNVFRSMMIGGSVIEAETYRIQAQLQLDAALFNPRHEDNYYIAAAILPWNGYVAPSQQILRIAADIREWDWMPAFFYAFGSWYFKHQMVEAGKWADIAATRSNPTNARALRAMAGRWYEQGDDPRLARGLIVAMQEQTRDPELKRQLQMRIERLNGLVQLRDAHRAFVAKHSRPADSLQQLVGYGELQSLPIDPAGLGYRLASDGRPALRLLNESANETD
ncbi:hypothetical protein M0M42_16525 [Pseudomonas knackmussii]|uniref:Uncharacterized protein n=1 Tax=Pseudomonas knackmussii TaxID=65741 RepID=A0ABY4KNK7_9PSED|nr:hypothetical protein [Pseudomonas knackmussii]UPQ81990.1 hypothetical protein M0M42_16525 [Pseudomonas knackmussii]